MTTTSVTVPNIPKPAFLKLVAPTQISINAKNAFLELSPQQFAQIQKDKDATTKWIKELFELPEGPPTTGTTSRSRRQREAQRGEDAGHISNRMICTQLHSVHVNSRIGFPNGRSNCGLPV